MAQTVKDNNSSSSKKPSGSGSQSQPADDEEEEEEEDDWGDDEEEEDESGVTIEEVKLVKKNNKAFIQVKGTDDGAAEKKWAWGLSSGGSFIIGDDKEGSTYSQAYTVGADKAFTVEWDLSTAMASVQDFDNGTYSVYGGNSLSYRNLNIDDDTVENVSDSTYKYYVRNDLRQLAIEKKLALEFKTAKVVLPTAFPTDYEDQYKGNHVQIIAPLPSGTTQATLDAFTVNGDFQKMNGYQKNNFSAYFWTIEGSNAVLNVYIGFMQDGQSWMTHLGLDAAAANLFLTDTIDDEEYTIGEWKYAIHSNPAAGQAGGEAEFYGCLGIKVLAAPAADDSEAE